MWRTQQLYKTTCQHYNNGSPTGKWCSTRKNVLPSTFPRRETQSTPFTSYTVIHLRVSLAASKYLGVHVIQDLSWNYHIQQTSAKASRSVGFLRRNLRGYPQDVKTQAYTTLVRPVLEYASTVWDPYTFQQIYALERVQWQAARFFTGDYSGRDPWSVTRMLQQLQWDTLEERRVRSKSIMLYRILNNLVEVPLHQYIQITTTRTRGTCVFIRDRPFNLKGGGGLWCIFSDNTRVRIFIFFVARSVKFFSRI
jgi:hypothetical protein